MNFQVEGESQIPSTATQKLPLPPIIILGGMAQSISSWEHHLPILSKDRDIFLYEYLGSGLGYSHPEFHNQYERINDLLISEVCTHIYLHLYMYLCMHVYVP